jgi:hypothetical protein
MLLLLKLLIFVIVPELIIPTTLSVFLLVHENLWRNVVIAKQRHKVLLVLQLLV